MLARELAEKAREIAEKEREFAEKEREYAAKESALSAELRRLRENDTSHPDDLCLEITAGNMLVDSQKLTDLNVPKGHHTSPMADKTGDRNELQGFRMKVEKFKGGEAEDYDVWWENLQAYFALHSYSEKDKIRLFNAHLGGEARKFLQNEDMEQLDTVEKLHELLRGTFSDKYDWHNVLMNIAQRPDEKIRPFSVRLRVAARKCGNSGVALDNVCVNYLKRSVLPHLKVVLGGCLPGTPYHVVVEHAIQHERARELENEKNEKKSSKRKNDDLDCLSECDETNIATAGKRNKQADKQQSSAQAIRSLKDQLLSLNEKLENRNSQSNPRSFNQAPRTGEKLPKLNACLHCAKPNHRYIDCRSANQSDKDEITRLLRERRFDWTKQRERAEAFLNRRRETKNEPNTPSLNSAPPPQPGS